jgi:hypothetical protein
MVTPILEETPYWTMLTKTNTYRDRDAGAGNQRGPSRCPGVSMTCSRPSGQEISQRGNSPDLCFCARRYDTRQRQWVGIGDSHYRHGDDLDWRPEMPLWSSITATYHMLFQWYAEALAVRLRWKRSALQTEITS